MHDPKQDFPPLQIIGLTGPIACGCSTITELFDMPGERRTADNALLNILRDEEIICKNSGSIKNDWKKINKKVSDSYQPDQTKKTKNGSGKMKFSRENLSDALEDRESYHALTYLNPYYYHNTKDAHLFRVLSISDIIVFHALLAIEQSDFDLSKINKKYGGFINVVIAEVENITNVLKRKAKIKGFKEYYKELYEQDTKKRKNLARTFVWIHLLSNRIKKNFRKVCPKLYTEILQDFGDNLRKTGNPFSDDDKEFNKLNSTILARDVVQMIKLLYQEDIAAFFVIDSLRNPYEVIYLRNEFANFLLLSTYEEKESRWKRYLNKAREKWGGPISEKEIRKVFEDADLRDSGSVIEKAEDNLFKQNVTKCVQISDISINNPQKEDLRLYGVYRKILRFLCLMLSPGCAKPNDDEIFMNMAYTMSVKSNCISRQVGAVIIGQEGYVVGAGWNDVAKGKVSCGSRNIADLGNVEEFKPILMALKRSEDKCEDDVIERLRGLFQSGNGHIDIEQYCFCFKDEMVKKDVIPRLKKAWHKEFQNNTIPQQKDGGNVGKIINDMIENVGEKKLEKMVEKGILHQLEYCLALHAEENAILQNSKIGGVGLKGGTIYTTAEPCTLCAKKIEQVGIKKVIFTDPYPKSLAEVYREGVESFQFEGVKPRAYIKLFMSHHDQKDWQELEIAKLNQII